MNIEENLILIKGEDKMEKIKWCEYNTNNKKYSVIFQNDKKYFYNYCNVEWIKKVKEFNIDSTILCNEDNIITGISKIIDFQSYIRVIFKSDYSRLYKRSELTIEESDLVNKKSKNVFQYLKDLSEIVNVKSEDNLNLIRREYERIKVVSPRTVLSAYLSGNKIKKFKNDREVIFPFGCNLSQREATEKAFENQISVIEGPPGTGKTQTILNIVANAIIRNKKVAIVSNNNSATTNVFEKLEKYGLDFICAPLGNNENKEKFFKSQRLDYPNMQGWEKIDEKLEELIKGLVDSQKHIDYMLEKKNRLARIKGELSELIIEYDYFKEYYDINRFENIYYKSIYNNNSSSLINAVIQYELTIKNKGRFNIIDKIRNLFKYGIISFKFYNNSNEDIIHYLKNTYYNLKLKELEDSKTELEKELEKFDFNKSMNEYSEISMEILKAKLFKKFGNKNEREKFTKDILWKNSGEFLDEYPIILSTTHSLRKCVSENYLFDYVIIDEASQVDIVTGALAFSCAKNTVIVGDLKQLPNVVDNEMQRKAEWVFEKYDLKSEYKYENSLLKSIVSLYKDIPKTLLREHYRCHPKIIGFCNKKFYNNELIILTEENKGDKPLKLYKTVKGNHARGLYNRRQIDVIVNEVIPNISCKNSIGIVSPYKEQVKRLKETISNESIEVDTIHKYQGREKDSIILTTVSNEVNDFIDNENLINVAVSRAVKEFEIIVSDNVSLSNNSNISDLINYIKYNNFEVINSKIYSVFDLLYKGYEEELLKIISKNKKVSRYNSEIIIYNLIEKILIEEEFITLDKVMHQPLRMLIKDKSLLNDIEYKFLMNPLTHTDFVIFNKVDKSPVLVIEVDGYKYHDKNSRQSERDRIKDGILNKYGINILRLKTNESGEKERIYNKLLELVSR